MSQAAWIIDTLIQHGITHFCIAPGSRSAPLALAAAEHPLAKITVHYDERGLGFYALGISLATNVPTAIITTSGTAIGNLMPAVMEAHYSHIPLILLTADRPHELRNCGANQATDQVKIFGTFASCMDLSPHIDEKSIRSIVSESVFQSLHKKPIHLNCPFQEPLHAKPIFSSKKPVLFSLPTLTAKPLSTTAKRGVILLGNTHQDPTPVLDLAKRLQWPVFADLLSQARQTPTPEQIRHFDYLIRNPCELKPDLILHFGDRFISKSYLEWEKDCERVHVSPFPHLQDPSRSLSQRIQSDIAPFCETLSALTDPEWLPSWQELDKLASTDEFFAENAFTEAHAIRTLPSQYPIFFGNSMPIRLADSFYFPRKAPQIFANRGLSGIDGNIATIAGIAEGLQSPIVAFIGDQTALHDLNSLPLLKKHKILLIISNNYGGAIFDHLPVSESPHLDRLFTATHSWNFEKAAQIFDIQYVKKEKNIDNLPDYGIVELITDRKENYLFQKSLKKCQPTLL